VRDDWSRLAAESRNVFGTPEFAELWWEHFGAGRRLHLLAAHETVLPLYEWRTRPFAILRFLGHGAGDQLGPIAGDRAVAANALREALRSRGRVLIADQLPADEHWETLIPGRVLLREGSPVLHFAGTWDDYLATRSGNLRQQLRRFERKLAALRYRRGDVDDLDTLFALHREHLPRSDFAGRAASFHRDFAQLAQGRGWLRMWVLENDERPLAAWQGFRFADVESYYQAGRVANWDGPPLGLMLLAHSIRAALEDGVTEYRFLRGAEPFKYRFATSDPGLVTLSVETGPVGALATRAGVAAWRARRYVSARTTASALFSRKSG
jgi:CelD/BcsL family acetyltransferase involved in cellulose biosynthesis